MLAICSSLQLVTALHSGKQQASVVQAHTLAVRSATHLLGVIQHMISSNSNNNRRPQYQWYVEA